MLTAHAGDFGTEGAGMNRTSQRSDASLLARMGFVIGTGALLLFLASILGSGDASATQLEGTESGHALTLQGSVLGVATASVNRIDSPPDASSANALSVS